MSRTVNGTKNVLLADVVLRAKMTLAIITAFY
jgi:hypothetical protein